MSEPPNSGSGRDVSDGCHKPPRYARPWVINVDFGGLAGYQRQTFSVVGLAERMASGKEDWAFWADVAVREEKMPAAKTLAELGLDLSTGDRRSLTNVGQTDLQDFTIKSLKELQAWYGLPPAEQLTPGSRYAGQKALHKAPRDIKYPDDALGLSKGACAPTLRPS